MMQFFGRFAAAAVSSTVLCGFLLHVYNNDKENVLQASGTSNRDYIWYMDYVW